MLRSRIITAFLPQDDVRVALVMEYAAGGELLHMIRKRLRLPDTEAKFYAAEIADALQYMHNEVGSVKLWRYARVRCFLSDTCASRTIL